MQHYFVMIKCYADIRHLGFLSNLVYNSLSLFRLLAASETQTVQRTAHCYSVSRLVLHTHQFSSYFDSHFREKERKTVIPAGWWGMTTNWCNSNGPLTGCLHKRVIVITQDIIPRDDTIPLLLVPSCPAHLHIGTALAGLNQEWMAFPASRSLARSFWCAALEVKLRPR